MIKNALMLIGLGFVLWGMWYLGLFSLIGQILDSIPER